MRAIESSRPHSLHNIHYTTCLQVRRCCLIRCSCSRSWRCNRRSRTVPSCLGASHRSPGKPTLCFSCARPRRFNARRTLTDTHPDPRLKLASQPPVSTLPLVSRMLGQGQHRHDAHLRPPQDQARGQPDVQGDPLKRCPSIPWQAWSDSRRAAVSSVRWR